MGALYATKRVWLPFVAAVISLFAASMAGPALTLVFIIAAFGFVLDGVTLLFSRAGSLSDHRQ